MDAVQLIKSDHERVKTLFAQYIATGAGQPDAKRMLAEQIIRELMVHERVEEEIFYPAFREMLGKIGQEEVEHAKEEHQLVDSLLAQLEELDLDEAEFEATFRVLKENVEHHIKDEEEKMLPLAKKHMGGLLPTLGRDMAEYKQNLERQLREAKPQGGAVADTGRRRV